MKQEKMQLINKIFNNETIRNIWNKLKHRLKEEGNETITNCNTSKFKAKDEKYRLSIC